MPLPASALLLLRFRLKCLSNAFIAATEGSQPVATIIFECHSSAQTMPRPRKRGKSFERVSEASDGRRLVILGWGAL